MFRATIFAILALALLPTGGASTPWEWPVADPHPIVRPYIAPKTPYSAGHRGIDIDLGATIEVRAPADGIVHFVGTVVDRPVLSIRHPDGLISSYEPVTSTLARGDVVTQGQSVGKVQAGHCKRACLHFGVRLDGDYVSPLNYLSGIPRAVLLPTRDP
jgi:murein DD-endopeptidase MepM/ murein hydrolase activator NlpD